MLRPWPRSALRGGPPRRCSAALAAPPPADGGTASSSRARGEIWRARSSPGALLAAAHGHLGMFEAEDYSRVLNRLQRLHRSGAASGRWLRRHSHFRELLSSLAEAPISTWPPKDMALASHALACLAVRSEAFFEAVASALPGKLASCKSQDVSNVVYALSLLQLRHDSLLTAVAEHVASGGVRRLRSFTPQSVSNTVYACGQLRFRHDGMLLAVCEGVPPRLEEFNHQHLSMVLYGLANLEYRHAGFLESVVSFLEEHGCYGAFTAQAVSNSVYALLRLGAPPLRLLRPLAAQLRAPGRLEAFAARDLAALASVGAGAARALAAEGGGGGDED